MCFVNCRTGMRPLSSILLEPAATDPCSKPSQMSLPLNESCTFHVIRPHCQGMSAFCTKRGSFWNGFVLLICSLRQCTSNASPHWFRIAASNHRDRIIRDAGVFVATRNSRTETPASFFRHGEKVPIVASLIPCRRIRPQNISTSGPLSRIKNTTGKCDAL